MDICSDDVEHRFRDEVLELVESVIGRSLLGTSVLCGRGGRFKLDVGSTWWVDDDVITYLGVGE